MTITLNLVVLAGVITLCNLVYLTWLVLGVLGTSDARERWLELGYLILSLLCAGYVTFSVLSPYIKGL